ncbi:rap guanine nucleotide exchange factor 3-like, partial [Scyliorhinus torazame]|uniref:rap guanine nucleotide exchange factor 3-like n=1 Tax=Scyliorhinus torazame TaxID=75743 RepID=UPI003B5BE005
MNSFFAIIFGLSNAAVSRLSETWERIPSRLGGCTKDSRGYWSVRCGDPTRNHRVYRQIIRKLNTPFLPFLPLLLKDMTFIQEGNKTFVNNLVNFEKMRMMARVVNLVRRCRSSPHAPAMPQKSTSDRLDVDSTLAHLSTGELRVTGEAVPNSTSITLSSNAA